MINFITSSSCVCFFKMLILLINHFYLQMSGLPLKVAVRIQINMAMKDVSSMAHVEKFSNLTIPMLWFEIVNIF